MFKKLDKMLERYEKLNELVSDPDVLSKMDDPTPARLLLTLRFKSLSILLTQRDPALRLGLLHYRRRDLNPNTLADNRF